MCHPLGAHLGRPGTKQAWLSRFATETGTGATEENLVAEEIVPPGTVSSSGAYQAMVPKAVDHTIAEGASVFRVENRDP